MRRGYWRVATAWVLGAIALGVQAQMNMPTPAEVTTEPLAQTTLTTMPVKEVSVFKDGYAFLVHEGTLPTDAQGHVLLDNLPQPVLGTFWAYVPQPGASLAAVLSGVQPVTTERKAINLRELIIANPGAEVTVNECGVKYPAILMGIGPLTLGIPEPTAPFSGLTVLLSKENTVYLRTPDGVREVELSRIQDIEFKAKPKTTVPQVQERNIISLRLRWKDAPAKSAQVGMFYLQQGIRWIPEYQLVLDGKGKATMKLQAALVNELTDLDDVTMHLVVGVPNFRFKGQIDPIALQQTVAQLSVNFQRDKDNFSNAMMTQVSGHAGPGAPTIAPDMMPPSAPAYAGPELGDSEKMQDLFTFTLNHVSLKKGQRMIVPIAEYTIPYEDIYTVNLQAMPPREALLHMDGNYQANIQQQSGVPTVKHILRLKNTSAYPITTAPVLVMQDGRPLAQSMTNYTAINGVLDLELTTAVDILVKQSEKELKRTQNAVQWQQPGTTAVIPLARIDLAGTISITNYRATPTRVEVTRRIAGNVTSADHDGVVTMLGALNGAGPDTPVVYPYWWGWYSWPSWWMRYNGLGQVTWNITVKPGDTVDLGYQWNYIWQ